MKINTDLFGTTNTGLEISRFKLVNSDGNEVQLMNWGATLLDVIVPDAKGERDNVNVSFATLQPYLDGHPYFGATIGRFCNRIGNASFEIGGKKYSLTQNHGDHHIHGGTKGLTYKRWESEPYQESDSVGVRFTIKSPDGEEGYPGNVAVTADYNWNNKNELTIVYSATTDAATHINLTNHSYWNLAGAFSGTALHHVAEIMGDQILKTDDDRIPTGEYLDVKGTAWDFETPTALGARIEQVNAGTGYDDCYVVRGQVGQLRRAARVVDPRSGRVLEIETTQPGVQLYTANFLPGNEQSNGVGGHEAFCLETQRYPNTPNVDRFPSTRLEPGEEYKETTVHRFSVA